MATLVKFNDTTDDSDEINFDVLLDDENIVCMRCGGTVKEGDYEIVKKFCPDPGIMQTRVFW